MLYYLTWMEEMIRHYIHTCTDGAVSTSVLYTQAFRQASLLIAHLIYFEEAKTASLAVAIILKLLCT